MYCCAAARNNFDMSSSGVNIEIVVFWDIGMSQYNWRENFYELEKDLYLYVNWGNIDPDKFKPFIIKDTKKNIKKMARKLAKERGGTIKERFEELSCYDIYGAFEELCSWLSIDSYEDKLDLLEELEIDYYITFEEYTTRGYSQGDVATVWIPTKMLEKIWGNKITTETMMRIKQDIHNFFWEPPLYLRIYIDGKEWYPEGIDGYYWNDIMDTLKTDPEVVNSPTKDFKEYVLKLLEKDYGDHPKWEAIKTQVSLLLPDLEDIQYC